MGSNTRYSALFASAALLTLSGCGTMHASTHDGQFSANDASADKRQNSINQQKPVLAERDKMLDMKDMKLADKGAVRHSVGNNVVAANGSEILPPNPQPGQCYARVLIPAQYETVTERMLKREAGTRIETLPAKLGWEEKSVEVKPATTRIELIPATYDTVTERVMVKPATSRLVEVPAQYETVTERVLDKAGHTTWKRSGGIVAGSLDTRIDSNTGEIMCLVEVPATYKTVTKTVLKTPASVREISAPAEYRTVTRTVVKSPATTREVTIPAQFKTVRVQKVIQPASSKEIEVPAQYSTVSKQQVVTESKLSWNSVLCDVNMTPQVVSNIQSKLKNKGYYAGRVDGRFGPATVKAINSFAKDQGMPQGRNFVSVDTAEALDVDF